MATDASAQKAAAGVGLADEELIGQMLVFGFRGTSAAEIDPFLRQVSDFRLGGVVLYDMDLPSGSPRRNIESREQLQALTQALQHAAKRPLLIAVDQEGGAVARLRPEHGFPAVVSHAELGRRNDPDFTFQTALAAARSLAECNVNVNFAPCVDLDIEPSNPIISRKGRAFSDDPEIVVRHAAAFIEAHHRAGVLCTLKHFPGHGSARSDSHLGLVDISECRREEELAPFRMLIERGFDDLIMTAHVFNRHWDQRFPATLSAAVIDGLLRRTLGYRGVVITDDLQMAAVSQHFGMEKAAAAAINAGADLLLFSQNAAYEPSLVERITEALLGMLARNEIPRRRIEESYARIQSLKSRLKASAEGGGFVGRSEFEIG